MRAHSLSLATAGFAVAGMLGHQASASIVSLPAPTRQTPPAALIVLAEAGSAGGVIGNANKSLSGAEQPAKSRGTARKVPKSTFTEIKKEDAGQTNEANCATRILGFK